MKTNRLLRWLFQRGKPTKTTVKVPTAWYIDRTRAMIGSDPELDDIADLPTRPVPCVDPSAATVAVPVEPLWFYVDETVAVPTK